ncbi:hypothetical protein V2J09_007555 [Rumex salicifolius]
MKVNFKALLLIALLGFCALQIVIGKHNQRRWREPELSPEEEWEEAEEEERRRQEDIREEEERHRHRRHRKEEEEHGGGGGRERIRGEDFFLLGEGKRVMRSEAGEMRVVKGFGYGGGRYSTGIAERPLHIGFITMEPRSMFVPQYLDSTIVLFLRRGEAKIGLIYKDALVERRLRTGDIYRVPAGSAFYIVNTAEGQRLHAICSIDPFQSLGFGAFQSFFISGGSNPTSVLAGFDPKTLSTALNVSIGELRDVMSSQEAGPFVYIDSHVPTTNPFANFESSKKEEKIKKLKNVVPVIDHGEEDDEDKDDDEEDEGWSLTKIINGIMGKAGDKRKKKGGEREGGDVGSGPDPFNVYEANPSFKNNYGSSLAVDKHVYKPLKKSHLSVYYVNLTAGTMLAPHINPTATEYGVVLSGSGTIEIVYPNGSTALNAKIREGSVFMVPRYFPFCQIASRSGPLEFFGFTTSAKNNHPQFLVGASSVIKSMWGQEIAAAFGLTEERLREIFDAQREAVALPSPGASPGSGGEEAEDGGGGQEEKAVPEGVKVLAREMIMG